MDVIRKFIEADRRVFFLESPNRTIIGLFDHSGAAFTLRNTADLRTQYCSRYTAEPNLVGAPSAILSATMKNMPDETCSAISFAVAPRAIRPEQALPR